MSMEQPTGDTGSQTLAEQIIVAESQGNFDLAENLRTRLDKIQSESSEEMNA